MKIFLTLLLCVFAYGSLASVVNSKPVNTGFYAEGGLGLFVTNKKKYKFSASMGNKNMTALLEQQSKLPSFHMEIGYTFNNWFALGFSNDFYKIKHNATLKSSGRAVFKGSHEKVSTYDMLIKANFIKQYSNDNSIYASLGAGTTYIHGYNFDISGSYFVPSFSVGAGLKHYFNDNIYVKAGIDLTIRMYDKDKESIVNSGLSYPSTSSTKENIHTTSTAGVKILFGYQF